MPELAVAPWVILAGVRIDAASEAEAQAALDALERTARRVKASVSVHIQASEEARDV